MYSLFIIMASEPPIGIRNDELQARGLEPDRRRRRSMDGTLPAGWASALPGPGPGPRAPGVT